VLEKYLKAIEKSYFLLTPNNKDYEELTSSFDSKEEAEKAKSMLLLAKIPCSIREMKVLSAIEHRELLFNKIKRNFMENFNHHKPTSS